MNGFCARESLARLRSARRLGTDGNTVMARSLSSHAACRKRSADAVSGFLVTST